MDQQKGILCTAFCGERRIASGALRDVVVQARALGQRGETRPVFIWENSSGRLIDIGLDVAEAEVLARVRELQSKRVQGDGPEEVPRQSQRGPGRPKLGVVGREVTLLPRHWEWLRTQPGGASVALRKLVEQARLANTERDAARQSQNAAYRFLSFMGGDLPGFEEASRALFRGEKESFETLIINWPSDIRDFAMTLASRGLGTVSAALERHAEE